MVWTPHSSDTLVDTLHRLGDLLELLSASISQKFGLLYDLSWLQILDTNCLLAPIDVVTLDDWVFAWTWRNGNFDLRVLLCEFRKSGLEESTVTFMLASFIRNQSIRSYVSNSYFMPLELPAQSQ